MAEETEESSPYSVVLLVLGVLVVLIILWFANDGPKKADLRGLFLQPPPPVGSGSAYGPQYGKPANGAPQVPTY